MGRTNPQQEPSLALEAHLPFWPHLTNDQRSLLAASAREVRYGAGEHVRNADAGCEGVMIVLSGTLRAYMLSEQGKEITLFRIGDSESCVLAAACMLPMITFDVFLDAMDDVDMLIVDADVFSSLMEQNVFVEAYSYRKTTERFSEVMGVMQQVLFTSFDARLASFLIDESARMSSYELDITHDQIARHLGSAREVVSRMLKAFERRGVVRLGRGTVTIVDKARLYRLASPKA